MHQASVTLARPEDLTFEVVWSKLKFNNNGGGSAPSSLPPSPNPQAFASGSPNPQTFASGQSLFRSNYPTTNAGASSNNDYPTRSFEEKETPPQIPEKEGTQLSRIRTNASSHSSHSVTTGLSLNSSQQFYGAESNRGTPSNSSVQVNMFAKSSPNHSPATSLVSVGLGIPSGANGHGHDFHRSASSTSATSPRLASLPTFGNGNMNDSNNGIDQGNKSGNGDSNPAIQQPWPTETAKSPRLASKFLTSSPKPSSVPPPYETSKTLPTAQAPIQQFPIPQQQAINIESSSPSASMEPSTFDRMLRLSESDMNVNGHMSLPPQPQTTSTSSIAEHERSTRAPFERTSTETDRYRVAEVIAMAAEQKWQSDRRSSLQTPIQSSTFDDMSSDVKGHHNPGDLTETSVLEDQKHTLQRQLRLEEERLQNLRAEERELNIVKRNAQEEVGSRGPATLSQSGGVIQQNDGEKKRLLELQRLEEDRLEALKAEQEQLLLVKKQVEEEAARQAEVQKQTDHEIRRKKEETQRIALEKERIQENEKDRLEKERVESIEREERQRREMAENNIRKKEEAKIMAKEGLQSRLNQSQGGQNSSSAVLTGFVSVQGGASIVRMDFSLAFSIFLLFANPLVH